MELVIFYRGRCPIIRIYTCKLLNFKVGHSFTCTHRGVVKDWTSDEANHTSIFLTEPVENSEVNQITNVISKIEMIDGADSVSSLMGVPYQYTEGGNHHEPFSQSFECSPDSPNQREV